MVAHKHHPLFTVSLTHTRAHADTVARRILNCSTHNAASRLLNRARFNGSAPPVSRSNVFNRKRMRHSNWFYIFSYLTRIGNSAICYDFLLPNKERTLLNLFFYNLLPKTDRTFLKFLNTFFHIAKIGLYSFFYCLLPNTVMTLLNLIFTFSYLTRIGHFLICLYCLLPNTNMTLLIFFYCFLPSTNRTLLNRYSTCPDIT